MQDTNEKLRLTCAVTAAHCHWSRARSESDDWPVQTRFMGKLNSWHRDYRVRTLWTIIWDCEVVVKTECEGEEVNLTQKVVVKTECEGEEVNLTQKVVVKTECEGEAYPKRVADHQTGE